MKIGKTLRRALAWWALTAAGFGFAAPADIADVPLVTSASETVLPNLMFVLDDSGSMAFDFLPDHVAHFPGPAVAGYPKGCRVWSGGAASFTGNCCQNLDAYTQVCFNGAAPFGSSRGAPPFMSPDYNGVYYNPAVRYQPPVRADGSSYPSQTSANTTGWTIVKNDAYGIQSTGSINLLTQFPDTEWCNGAGTRCARNGNYVLPGVYGGTSYTTFKAVVASGTGTLATGPASSVVMTSDYRFGPHYYQMGTLEWCDSKAQRRCQATQSVVYSIPSHLRWCSSATEAAKATPAANACQAQRTTTYIYPRYVTIVSGNTGSFTRVDIVPTRATYPRSTARVDCAASTTTCSYAEEMTNFANWWTYYRTRMQTMKSSASLAFQSIGRDFRLGFVSLNRNTGADFLNLGTFDGTHRTQWFSKLTSAVPNDGTPLRSTLAQVGRLYGGQLNGTTISGSKVVDPVQFSCQQNFTLLSTDGYWNETDSPKRLDGTTVVGDADGSLPRPLYDGNEQSNTLADVAAYYYETDLRTGCGGGTDLCTNNVKTSGVDVAVHQHMTTFTLGLGASGYMRFEQNYGVNTNGEDFISIRSGATANPSAGVCSWQSSGSTCNWPSVTTNTMTTIDDLWHAAVNGRGTYFSAGDPATLRTGLSQALLAIQKQQGSAAAVASSNPNVATGDNFLFGSAFEAGVWTGNLVRRQINVESGTLASAVDWEAAPQLNANASRRVLTFAPAAGGTRLKSFAWGSLSEAEQDYFSLAHITTGGRSLSQFCTGLSTCLSATAQAAAAGESLVEYLAGSRAHEGVAADTTKYFRQRNAVLGDIVDSVAAYVKRPMYRYSDAGYSEYRSTNASRQGMVYVGANDGMLHAFNADTGAEAWAYVPSLVLPDLYHLADKEYANRHRFYVNGSPAIGDVKDSGGAWRTLLVGGLGAGGRGYYALDVTDPATPRALWEFTADASKAGLPGYTTDANLGLGLGKAEIGKLKDGTWVVLIASGYNNIDPGTGRGYLYVLNAMTGALIRTLDTGAGSTTTPLGLAQIRGWADVPEIDATVQRVYAGDNQGNVWRFDINGDVGAAGYDAQLLATLRSESGTVQPVTTRPELGLVGTVSMVYVGTGRYLGGTDVDDNTQQSIYAIKDALDAVGVGEPRHNAKFVEQTMTTTTCGGSMTGCAPGQQVRQGSSNAVNLASNDGWYLDLPASERIYTDPQLGLGTLALTSNIVQPNACQAGGSSWFYFFDYRSGAPIASLVGEFLGNSLAAAPSLIRLESGKVIAAIQDSKGEIHTEEMPTRPGGGDARRISWREIAIDR